MVIKHRLFCLFLCSWKNKVRCLISDSSPHCLLFHILKTTDLERPVFFIVEEGTNSGQMELESVPKNTTHVYGNRGALSLGPTIANN